MILVITLSAFLSVGFYLSLSALLCLPSGRTVKAINAVNGKRTVIQILTELLKPLSGLLNKISPLSEYKARELQAAFDRLSIQQTPEAFIAESRSRSLLIGIVGLLFIPIGVPWLTAIIAVTAVLSCFKTTRGITQKVEKIDDEILTELPRLLETLVYSLSEGCDLLSFFSQYRGVAGTALGPELDKLIFAMQTGNHERALKTFDARLRIPEVSALVAALCGVHQGGDRRTSLLLLEQDVRTKERERLRRKLEANPRRIKTACFIITTLMIGMFMVPIILMIMNDLSSAGL